MKTKSMTFADWPDEFEPRDKAVRRNSCDRHTLRCVSMELGRCLGLPEWDWGSLRRPSLRLHHLGFEYEDAKRIVRENDSGKGYIAAMTMALDIAGFEWK